jgi:acyl-coenzyme A thioesterase 13
MSDSLQPTISPDQIKGNASLEARKVLSNPAAFFTRRSEPGRVPCFGDSIHRRFVVTEAYIQSKREDEQRKEAMIVVELDVTDGEWSTERYILKVLKNL